MNQLSSLWGQNIFFHSWWCLNLLKRTLYKLKTRPQNEVTFGRYEVCLVFCLFWPILRMQLDRKPSKCVVFEDDPRGVTAAHNCTMMAVGLIGAHPAYVFKHLVCCSLSLSGVLGLVDSHVNGVGCSIWFEIWGRWISFHYIGISLYRTSYLVEGSRISYMVTLVTLRDTHILTSYSDCYFGVISNSSWWIFENMEISLPICRYFSDILS